MLIGAQHPRGPAMIRGEESGEWPLVRLGVYSETQALAVFDGIFEEHGRLFDWLSGIRTTDGKRGHPWKTTTR